jgi:Fur family zinc uptake transcriptional regulator
MSMKRPDPDPGCLAAVPSVCSGHEVTLTAPRRAVLELLLAAGRPLGAYDLIEQMSARRGTTNPPTVYRALGFLEQMGLIHRLDSQKAYVACRGNAGAHRPVFLVCRECGRATEVEMSETVGLLEGLAKARGFVAEQITQQIEGRCEDCAGLSDS